MTPTTPTAPQSTVRPAPHDHRRHRRAAEHAVASNSTNLHFVVADTEVRIQLPPTDKLAYYAGLAGAAAFGVIEWPIALIAGLGHALSDDRHNRMVRALGEALDAV